MSRLIIPYNLLIIFFCVSSTLLLLSSPHHVDKEFLIANTSALIVFPLTAYFLSQTYRKNRWTKTSVLLLVLTCCITFYYINDLVFNSIDKVSSIVLYPIIIVLLSIIFIVNILLKRPVGHNSNTNNK